MIKSSYKRLEIFAKFWLKKFLFPNKLVFRIFSLSEILSLRYPSSEIKFFSGRSLETTPVWNWVPRTNRCFTKFSLIWINSSEYLKLSSDSLEFSECSYFFLRLIFKHGKNMWSLCYSSWRRKLKTKRPQFYSLENFNGSGFLVDFLMIFSEFYRCMT